MDAPPDSRSGVSGTPQHYADHSRILAIRELWTSDPTGKLTMDVFPDFDGLAGIGDLKQVVGALFMFVLIIAVLMLIVSAIIWAVSASSGNYSAAAKGRVGVLVALGAAALAGGGVAWMNWLIALGRQL